MKMFLCLFLVVLFSSCSLNYSEQDIKDITSSSPSEGAPISQEYELPQGQEESKLTSSDTQTFKKKIRAHTNFELKNGGFEPEFTVTLCKDIILDGKGDNLMAVFTDGNRLPLGWCFIYEIRTYNKYDNPLYYYENPEESLGYISHEMVTCGSYKCKRIMCQEYGGKEETNSSSYRFDYYIIINDSEMLSLSFYAPTNSEDTLLTQAEFISAIER